MKKSRAFYEGVLGLKTGSEFNGTGQADPAWIEYTVGEPGPGESTFAIGCSPEWKTSQDGALVAFEVENFDEFVAGLKAKGVAFKLEPMSFPSCNMAVVEDPDKNRVIIHRKK